MSLGRYVILVVVLVGLGLLTVWQHLRLLSAGYEINTLRAKRTALEEEVRVLERRIDAMATPAAARERLGAGGAARARPEGSRP
jgi:hypothetical protein